LQRTPYWLALGLSTVALTGCQSYEPAPINLKTFDAEWQMPDLTSPAWKAIAETGDIDHIDPNTIDLRTAEAMALYGNPQLRKVRALAGVTQAASEHAGVWDDPNLDFGLLYNTDVDSDPWVIGVSLGFTIPISGRLEVAQEQANAEALAELYRVAEAEWQTVQEAQQAWVAWSAVEQKVQAVDGYLAEFDRLATMAQSLADVGELAPTDARLLRIQLVHRQLERTRLQTQADEAQRTLMALMGLRPNAPVTLSATQIDVDKPIEPGDFDNHPSLVVAQAEYQVAELALKREIRKQYPDLTIGPSYEDDEGQSKIGLGLGLPIPSWNMNRGGIAEARAARSAAQAGVELAYQEAISKLAQAEARLAAAIRTDESTRSNLLPLVETQVTEARQLMELGEVDVLLLNEALTAVAETRLAVLDAAAEKTAAALNYQEQTNPSWPANLPPIAETNQEVSP